MVMTDRAKRLRKEFIMVNVSKAEATKAKDALNPVWNKMLNRFVGSRKSRGHRDLSFISDMIGALQAISGKV